MSLGIGLGAFMEGMNSGMQMRDRIDARNRERKSREQLDSLNAETQAKFDAGVKTGQFDPAQFDEFWMSYALPRREKQLILDGDLDGARALRKWGESDAAKEGGQLFASALLKAQTGDAAGALDDAIKAGQVKGYIDHGYELAGKEEIVGPDGKLRGYRLTMKNEDGKEEVQDVPVDKLPQMIATYLNPSAAFTSQQKTETAAARQKRDLETYAAKKKIDQAYSPSKDAESYAKARAERMKNDLNFMDLTPDEQDKVVRSDLAAGKAYAADQKAVGLGPNTAPAAAEKPAAPQKIVVDRATGEPVQASPSGPADPAEPAAAAPTQSAPAAAREPGLGVSFAWPVGVDTAAPNAATVPTPRPQPAGSTAGPKQAAMIETATRMVANGGDPRAIGDRLEQAGVSPDLWPAPLKQAYVRARRSEPVGLGVQ